jgi:hypothetical protein
MAKITRLSSEQRENLTAYLDGELDHTMSMAISGERIAAIYIVRNPDKLRHLPLTPPV